MPEEKVWHHYITEARKEADPAKLRAIVNEAARDLCEAEDRYGRLQRELETDDARDEKSARALRAAHAARQIVAVKAIRALTKLLPNAIAQARKGKPALLRLILRATK